MIEAIRNNPKSVRFEDACNMARPLGFIHTGGKGSHQVFKKPGEPEQLNFQNRNGCIPPYQARQLLAMMRKYEVEK
ncbi:MAG: type II toxin-antitoxin system HicA family toxin [Candidatus Competibacteraceae bacterium]